MAHGILQNDTMFSVVEKPWHGLGTVIQTAPTIEEGIKLAGLDWNVELKQLQTADGLLTDKNAVVRTDRNEVLGVVGNGYKPVQNIDAFNFFSPFIENDIASLETAGSLFNGKKVFVLAKINDDDMVIDEKTNDTVQKYILFSNGHDGTSAIRVGFTAIRVVCNNTLNFAISADTSKLIRVMHKGNVEDSLLRIRDIMDTVNKDYKATEEQYKYLVTRTNINTNDLHNYVKQVFSTKKLEDIIKDYETKQLNAEQEKQEVEAARKRLIARVEEIWELQPVHNAWTMYNSVNSYLNHHKNKDINDRYQGIWFGNARQQDLRALQLATKY